MGKVAEGELVPTVYRFHGEASRELTITLRVHQSKALEVSRGKVGGDLAAGGNTSVRVAMDETHQGGQGTEGCRGGHRAC